MTTPWASLTRMSPSRLGRLAAAVAANVWAQYNGDCVGGNVDVDQIIPNSSSKGKLQI